MITKMRKEKLLKICHWCVCLAVIFWLSIIRSKPVYVPVNIKITPERFRISSELTSTPERLSNLWISTRDNILRKSTSPINHRYGLQFKNIHLLLVIVLAGDIATNPGPNNQHLRCLSFNAQSIRSTRSRKLPDGSYTSDLKSFQDIVLAEELDLIFVTESWLNDNFSDKEILPKGYNIVRKDRSANQRGGGISSTTTSIPFSNLLTTKCPFQTLVTRTLILQNVPSPASP